MFSAIAAGLLVFTGVWHLTEWLMGGRNRETVMLIPAGAVFLALGCLVAAGIGGVVVTALAILASAGGAILAFSRRNTSQVRKWVTWAYVIIDVLIVVLLAASMLG